MSVIEQTCIESFAYSHDTLRKLRGQLVRVRATRRDGSRVSREGIFLHIGLKNITVEVASGRTYRIPLTAILAVEAADTTVTVESESDSLKLCMSCFSSYTRSGRWYCSAGLDVNSSMTDSTVCGGFEDRHGRCRNE
jgi:DNA-binding LytR/AlgR family response regulator